MEKAHYPSVYSELYWPITKWPGKLMYCRQHVIVM